MTRLELSIGKNLHDAKWHEVTVSRRHRETKLIVDQASRTKLNVEDFKELNLDTAIYVGGVRRGGHQQTYAITGMQNYKGCMRDVIFGKVDLLKGAKDGLKDFIKYGKPEFECKHEEFVPVTFLSTQSYVKVTLPKLSRDNNTFSTSFKFRTFQGEGLLFSRSAVRVKFHLQLRSGSLVYTVMTPNGSKSFLRLGSELNDGDWHSVNASINGPSGKLKVSLDGNTQSRILNQSSLMLAFANKSLLKIFAGRGGPDSKYPSFVGCMLNLKVDSHRVTLRELKKKKYSQSTQVGECSLKNYCFPDPCNKRGKCRNNGNQFVCTCNSYKYEGKRCEKSIFEATCEVYKALGLRRDSLCLLDSVSSDEPYTALCNVTHPERTYTIISHSEEMKKIRVGDGKNPAGSKFYKHDIGYDIGLKDIIALTEKSKKCRQYIRYDCYNAKLLNAGSGIKGSGNNPHAFWVSRNGSKQRYWGGATPGSGVCACGMKNECVNPFKSCNCDSRDTVWRVDDGYLNDKNSLPVIRLLFHSKSAESFYKLGPLECWGMKTSALPTPTDKANEEKLRKVCPRTPTVVTTVTAITTTTEKTEKTSSAQSASTQDPCGRTNHDCFSQSLPADDTAFPNTTDHQSVDPTTVDTNDKTPGVPGRQTDPSSDGGLSTAFTALISCCIVVLLLLTMKLGLPRVIVCMRTHSKKGEYIVPPTGVGYPARLMPLVTGRKAPIRGRLTHHGDKHVEGNGTAGGGIKSYWV